MNTPAYMRAYFLENRERILANSRRYRAKKYAEDPAYAERERERGRVYWRGVRASTWALTHPPRACPTCNGIFTPAKRNDQLCCSRACLRRRNEGSPEALAARRQKDRESYRPARWSRSARSCVGCGISFTPAHREDQLFCDRRCGERDVIRVYGVRLSRRTGPAELVAIAGAIQETKALLKGETP